jgi:hypothetical protein
MFRVTRGAVAGVLAIAIAALPVVLDRCAESCEAHANAVASTPTCHHVTSTGTRISPVPSPCGHDHNGTAVTAAAKSFAPTGRAFDSIAAFSAHVPEALLRSADLRVGLHSPPHSSPSLTSHSLPLRV